MASVARPSLAGADRGRGDVCAFLSLASVFSALARGTGSRIHKWQRRRAAMKAVRDYIPHMTDQERGIVGWLLAKNQTMFRGAFDGGYATTLISRGIVVRALVPGQGFDAEEFPFAVPPHAWEVLAAHRTEFPAPPADYNGPHPWRVSWMLR
ncbi:MAG: hypothetical protein ACHP7N_02475 [Caulobacterales bacterium]